MTRRDTHGKDLTATYKDKALKNRIQEETKLTACIQKIISIIHRFNIKRVNSNITLNMNIIIHRNY